MPDSVSTPPDSVSAETKGWDVESPGIPADTLSLVAEEGTWISIDVHPSGDRIVLDLLGDIYTLPISGGEATPISRGLSHETQPRWSPDGTRIAFTSDRGGGDNIWIMNADGSEREALTKETFRLLNSPAWHPSGEYVVARKHFTSRRSLGAGEMWLYRVPEGGGGVQLTERKNDQQDAGEPVFSPDGRYLYWSEDMSGGSSFEYNKEPNATIYVIRRLELESGEVQNLIRVPGGAVRPQPSPDGKALAFVKPYVVPFPLSAREVEVSPKMTSLPVRGLGGPAGTYLSWSADGTRVRWSLGPKLYEPVVDDLYTNDPPDKGVEGEAAAPEDAPEAWSEREGLESWRLGWDEPAFVPNADLYLVGGRILTMTGTEPEPIEDGVVHIFGDRIEAVGSRAAVPVPPGARVMDVAGTTVLPGLIDVHAHTGSSNAGVHAEQSWAFLANLAFGVTTTHDPSNDTQMIFASAERVHSGRMIGPRIFSTGTILYGADGGFKAVIDSYEDARDALARTQAWGAFSVKS